MVFQMITFLALWILCAILVGFAIWPLMRVAALSDIKEEIQADGPDRAQARRLRIVSSR